MKHLFILLSASALWMLSSCGEKKEETHDTPPPANTNTTSTTAAPAANPAGKPPFAIADSSKVMNLEGGVKLYTIQEGSGISPKVESVVVANYHGRLKDGSVFDSSFDRGKPLEMPLTNVIKGWQVGFTKMKPGARFVLVIPAEMGYGAQVQPKIPANSTLIFDCELITVK